MSGNKTEKAVPRPDKVRFTPPPHWSSAVLHSSPIFADLIQYFSLTKLNDWPTLSQLNGWAVPNNHYFVDSALLDADGRYYEEFIAATRQIPTRQRNWHDVFGALIWCLFPRTKALLNQLHMAEIALHGLKQRSKLRNKLTLLDECGVIICMEPAAIGHATLLRNHQWQQSFVMQRTDWWQSIRPVIFGHAMYEMATAPFIGLTAKAVFVEVPTGFGQWPMGKAYAFIDKLLAELVEQGILLQLNQLTPLPLLGVPAWHDENSQPAFYHNTDYFRPKRASK